MSSHADFKDRQFLAVIGDEASHPPRNIPHTQAPTMGGDRIRSNTGIYVQDSVTGLLLAGIGHITTGAEAQKNFLVVDNKTETAAIESAFESFTSRKDIGIVLINQHVSLLWDGLTNPPHIVYTDE
ncbi:hypothetical protein ACHAPX_001894 [Trichoderma viride]